MKVEFWFVGKTKEPWVTSAIEHYVKRCSRYALISVDVIPESRITSPDAMCKDETERVLAKLRKSQKGFTILLVKTGKQIDSVQFSELIGKQQSAGHSTIRFIIGGAYGFEPALHKEVDYELSLSTMTFPHQLVRIIFMEQLYRAFTILRGEGYHHE